MTASVPPDREAALVAELLPAATEAFLTSPPRWDEQQRCSMHTGVEAVVALVVAAAREDGKAEGRREAAEAIEWVRSHYPTDVFPDDSPSADAQAGRFARTICDTITGILARGAQQPDEKERTGGQ